MRNILKYTVTSSLLFFGGFVQALSLGEPQVQSAVGSPLEVRIPVNNAEELEGQELRIALISRTRSMDAQPPETFAGDVRYDRASQSILLSSKNPVSAPQVSFTLNIRWNEGFLQRAYAVNLKNSGLFSRRSTTVVSPTTVLPAIVAADESAHRQYAVERGDTLWTIARSVSIGRDGSHAQWMATVYQRNADAFIGGRPDRIREAYSLDIPQQCSKVRLVLDADGRSFRLIDAEGRVVTQQIFSDTRTAITGDASAPSSIEPSEKPGPAEEPRVAVYQSKDEIERTHQVVRGETLWGIADRLSSGKGGNRAQWMAALFRLNPRAFIAGRPNRLREGFALSIPSEAGAMEMQFEADGVDYAMVEGSAPTDSAETDSTATETAAVDTPAPEAESFAYAAEAETPTAAPKTEVDAPSAESLQAQSEPAVAAKASSSKPAAAVEKTDAGVFEYEGKSFVSDPYADTADLQEPANAEQTEAPTQDENERLRELEAQLDQALAVIDKEAVDTEQQGGTDEDASGMLAELSPKNSLLSALGWIALGMALVVGFGVYRDRRSNNPMVLRDHD